MTPPDLEVHGDVKTFVVAGFPFTWFAPPALPATVTALLPPDLDPEALLDSAGLGAAPYAQGVADVRGKLDVHGEELRFTAHHAVSLLSVPTAANPTGSSTGVALSAPELVDLTWTADTGDALTIRGRTDRLLLSWSPPHVTVAVGRQPISFGTGLFFTPMDVVNPFSAATIDTEYKPGVDALRVDGFWGVAGRVTAVAAYAGALPIHHPDVEPSSADLLLATTAQGTVGVTDLIGLVAFVHDDWVFGAGTVSSVGHVGLHADLTVTVPAAEAVEDVPFVRAVAGGDLRPTPTTTVSVELYHQGLGASEPSGYLDIASGPRAARSEIWQLGRWYGGLALAQEITPLVAGNVAVIANVADPSALISPGLSWSVADEAVVAVGAYFAAGARPDEVPLGFDLATLQLVPPSPTALSRSVNSEFGLYPHALFLQMRAYF